MRGAVCHAGAGAGAGLGGVGREWGGAGRASSFGRRVFQASSEHGWCTIQSDSILTESASAVSCE